MIVIKEVNMTKEVLEEIRAIDLTFYPNIGPIDWYLARYKPWHSAFVAMDEGKIVGYYSLAMLDNGSVELNNLSVLPEFRHLGIGEKLVKDAIEKAKSFDKEKMELGIVEENKKLRIWYESLGFIHTGTKKFDFFPFTCGYMEMKL